MIQAIHAANAAAMNGQLNGTPSPMRQLAVALRNDDLPAARDAYVKVVQTAPEGATWPKEGAFGEIGRALLHGDMATAKQLAGDALRARMDMVRPPAQPGVPPGPERGAVPAAAGGMAGGTVDVVA